MIFLGFTLLLILWCWGRHPHAPVPEWRVAVKPHGGDVDASLVADFTEIGDVELEVEFKDWINRGGSSFALELRIYIIMGMW
jgi:hypothetical protein